MLLVWWKKFLRNFRQCFIKLLFCFSTLMGKTLSYFYKVARYKLNTFNNSRLQQDSVALEGFLCEFSFDLPFLKLWIHHWCGADLSGFVLTYKAWIKSNYIQKYINWNSVHRIIYFLLWKKNAAFWNYSPQEFYWLIVNSRRHLDKSL